ncbi:AAA family ATPase [Cytobacillus spongiae]|uniref:ATP-binding protein n=1 Tax=Cytobacillus spongiae TaxID=2901381 RepID=UPI001F2E335E|nr:AAA family ATPase [Cytobacillus spongiae]UII56875.1 AAA family ATPase [Cytobacillus spongiae]
MRILGIHIYGYGKLENYRLDNLQNMVVLYGENEAGKSTIMSFIHSILFGFPTKQQAELRYEPKLGSKYGGQLIVQFPNIGKVVIERVKGKAVGDVSVVLEDGTRGTEELLKELLNGIDKVLYQSIFSFNLHGLQNVHHMKKEDLGKYLFSTGAVGTDQLFIVENQLQKELDTQFKPNGRKPYINQQLIELKKLQGELLKAEQQNDRYWILIEEKERLEYKIAEEQKYDKQLQKDIDKLRQWTHFLPYYEEKLVLEEELAGYDQIFFPSAGLERLDQLNELKNACERQIHILQERMSNTREQIEQIQLNEQLIAKELDVTTSIESLPVYERLRQEEGHLIIQVRHLTEELDVLKEKLNLKIEDDKISNVDTSVFMEEKTAKAQAQQNRLKEEKQTLDRQFQIEQRALTAIEEQLESLKKSILTETERQKLQEKITGWKSSYQLEEIERRILFLQNSQKVELQQQKHLKQQTFIQMAALSLLFSLLIGWGIVNKEWFLVIASLIGSGFILFSKLKKPLNTSIRHLEKEISETYAKKEQLLSMSTANGSHELSAFEEMYSKDQMLREQLYVLEMKWEQQNTQYENVIEGYEKWEKEAIEHEEKIIQLGHQLSIPKNIALTNLHDAFQLIDKYKTVLRTKKNHEERLETIQTEASKIVSQLEELQQMFMITIPVSLQETASLLRNMLKEEYEKRVQHKEQETKLKELKEEWNELYIQQMQLEKEIGELFKLANVENEEEFYELGQKSERKKQLEERLIQIQKSLYTSPFGEKDHKEIQSKPDIAGTILELEEQMTEKEHTIHTYQEKLAKIQYEINLLEEGGTYGQLLHTFNQKKFELNEDVKKWAKLAIAKTLLSETVDRYKKERLPQMLKKAEEYLQFLTGGKYIHIHSSDEGNGFLIERKDHVFFQANELSQATSEQVYVSIRLALATTLYKSYTFPFMIDDSFVNFDEGRTEKVMELLKELAPQQVWFFTCHQHLLTHFSKEQVISLSTSSYTVM